ncbi:uncharacterized protein BJ212DRAFT_1008104 [Suillus subaureus]|uniref:Uncharacterized protein n=1 Tax=Suillus subaureus TaxID=48587 RepID=A0A9P7EF54_9AGAM|nr:uncharacterized protein BJ212DRAFT_1008104 [Suillus subaureus]KAG1820197.1 hypothetical protein BJ212DRAFT_1008104 [Suillus subaureus]
MPLLYLPRILISSVHPVCPQLEEALARSPTRMGSRYWEKLVLDLVAFFYEHNFLSRSGQIAFPFNPQEIMSLLSSASNAQQSFDKAKKHLWQVAHLTSPTLCWHCILLAPVGHRWSPMFRRCPKCFNLLHFAGFALFTSLTIFLRIITDATFFTTSSFHPSGLPTHRNKK